MRSLCRDNSRSYLGRSVTCTIGVLGDPRRACSKGGADEATHSYSQKSAEAPSLDG